MARLGGIDEKAISFPLTKHTDTDSNVIYLPNDPEAEIKAERADPNVAICVRLIANSLSWLPLYVKSFEYNEKGDIEYTTEPDHPASKLMDRPNDLMTRQEILTYITQAFLLAGYGYININTDEADINLWPIQSWRMEVEYNKEKLYLPSGYLLDRNRGQEKRFELEEIIMFKNFNILDIYYGRSLIEPLRRQIMMDYYSEKYNQKYFKNNAIPGSMFVPEFEMDEEQGKQFRKTWNAANRGADKAFGFYVAPKSGKLEVITPPLKDMAFIDMGRANRERIFGLFGTPPSMGGVYEYANYANAKIQEESFWRHTMIPIANLIALTLTRQLLWKHFDENHVFKFDFSGVEALQGDEVKKATKYKIACGGPWMTVNEVRAKEGLEEVEDGDTIRQNSAPNINQGGETEAFDKSAPLSNRKVSPAQINHWKAFDKNLTKHERGFARILKTFFSGQEGRVLKALNVITGKGAMWNYGIYKIFKGLKDKPDDLPEDMKGIFDVDIENAALGEVAIPQFRKTVGNAGQDVFDQLSLDMVFDVKNPEVDLMIDNLKNKIGSINETSYGRLKNLLTQAYDDNYSLSQLENEIRALFKGFRDARIKTITRTEMLKAVNGGTFEAYKQGPINKKQWLAAPGARDTHAALDGEVASVKEPFIRGSVPMMYPGDPTAPANEVCNCRCTMMPYIEEDD